MRNLIIVSMLGALVFGCGKDDSKGSSAAKAGESKASATDYTAIDSMVAKAKTSDEFIDIVMECGKIEIDTRGKATNDPVHVQACSVSPTHARAKLAIAESTPDKMSIHCITASMNLDELIEKKLALEDSKKLLAQVNKACDMWENRAMRAARIHEYGEPDVFRIEDIDAPSVGPRDVLIEAHAASVNPIDYKIRRGGQRGVIRYKFPVVLGLDLSGVVLEVGADVTRGKIVIEIAR